MKVKEESEKVGLKLNIQKTKIMASGDSWQIVRETMETVTDLMHSFPSFEPVHCPMSSSNCCFLSCKQASQEASKVVWYSHLFKNIPQFVVIHTRRLQCSQ